MRFPGRKAVGGRKGHKNAAAARSRTAQLTVQVLVGTAAAKGAQNALTHGQGALTPGPAPNGPAGPGCATAAVHAFTSFQWSVTTLPQTPPERKRPAGFLTACSQLNGPAAEIMDARAVPQSAACYCLIDAVVKLTSLFLDNFILA